jgi:hypothetical protein
MRYFGRDMSSKLIDMISSYENGTDWQALLTDIPMDSNLIRFQIPQFERVRGSKVLLILGM